MRVNEDDMSTIHFDAAELANIANALRTIHELDEVHEGQGEFARQVGVGVQLRVVHLIEPYIKFLLNEGHGWTPLR